eukprot:SAG31_NODE_32738_length_352_cov_0.802372_1_plen_36_part_01
MDAVLHFGVSWKKMHIDENMNHSIGVRDHKSVGDDA